MSQPSCIRCGIDRELVQDPRHDNIYFCRKCLREIASLMKAIEGAEPDDSWPRP